MSGIGRAGISYLGLHIVLHGMRQAGAGVPYVLPAHFQFGLFLALDTRCWPCAGGSPTVVRLLPSGPAINSTPDLWLLYIPAMSCQPLQGKVRGARRHNSFPADREEADGAQESQVRQTEPGRQRNKAAGRSRQCPCLLIFGQ